LLRHARESRGLTLERIARETKIPQRHLEALERGHLGLSPAGFYQRAEIRAYARAVGLDEELALAQLRSASTPVEAQSASPEIAKAGESTRPRTFGLIALALAAVALGAALLGRATSQSAPSSEVRSDPVPAPVVAGRDSSPDTTASTSDSIAQAASVEASDAGVQGTIASPDSSAPASPVTELVVTTQPAGARVTVNGIGWGVSPVTIHHMPPGDKRIRVSKEGYASEERLLRVGAGQRQTLDVQLAAAP
jgi:cytoskeletal protein RodZ